jgi:hypothetical protein
VYYGRLFLLNMKYLHSLRKRRRVDLMSEGSRAWYEASDRCYEQYRTVKQVEHHDPNGQVVYVVVETIVRATRSLPYKAAELVLYKK